MHDLQSEADRLWWGGACLKIQKTRFPPTLNLLPSIPQHTTKSKVNSIVQPSTTISKNIRSTLSTQLIYTLLTVKMQSITCIITFMVMTLFYALCASLPHEADFPVTLPNNFNFTDTGVWRAVTPDPDSILSVPNLSPDALKNKDRCFYWKGSEKWSDVGGQHSQFVHDSLFHMCDVIATFTSNTGLRKDDVVSDNLLSNLVDTLIFADYCP